MIYKLPFENPFEIPTDCIVNFAQTKFDSNFEKNINTAFIYLRNIDFSGKILFSDCTYEQRVKILKLYINREIKSLKIKELDDEILKCFFIDDFNMIESDYFSTNERINFISENKEILFELFCFIKSIPVFILFLDKNKIIDFKINQFKIADEKIILNIYQCALSLLSEKVSSFLSFIPEEAFRFNNVKIQYYPTLFKYDNFELADLTNNLIFSFLYQKCIDLL